MSKSLLREDYKYSRHKKREVIENVKWAMHSKVLRWYDYTPLFKFLLKNIWSNWDDVYSEAISRLDTSEPIFWIVAIHENEKKEYVRIWESSYFSGMYVDKNGILQLTKPNLCSSDIGKACDCCTYTLNGEVFKAND